MSLVYIAKSPRPWTHLAIYRRLYSAKSPLSRGNLAEYRAPCVLPLSFPCRVGGTRERRSRCHAAPPLECAGKVRRQTDGDGAFASEARAHADLLAAPIQSGVALRLPPHSKGPPAHAAAMPKTIAVSVTPRLDERSVGRHSLRVSLVLRRPRWVGPHRFRSRQWRSSLPMRSYCKAGLTTAAAVKRPLVTCGNAYAQGVPGLGLKLLWHSRDWAPVRAGRADMTYLLHDCCSPLTRLGV